MQLTIVRPDNLTLVNGQAQHFDLASYPQPEHFWALQWRSDQGHIEYDLSATPQRPPDAISELPDWTQAIIHEHQRRSAEQLAEQQRQQRQGLFLENGQARRDRLSQRRRNQMQTLQQAINQHVLETMS